jgi:hypothetical protein
VKEYVAVNDSMVLFDLSALKREALMFDRVALPFFSQISAEIMEKRSQTTLQLSEVEWLMGEGIVFEPELNFDNKKLAESDEFRSFMEASVSEGEHIATELAKGLDIGGNLKGVEEEAFAQLLSKANAALAMFGFNARYISAAMRVLGKVDAYPVLSAGIPSAGQGAASRSGEVLQIALNALPVPDESTPWEQIIEYRSDEDSRHKFLDLRNWMGEVARSELTPAEAEQKLEHLISQYQRHMKLHRMKTNTGTLETVVTTSLEVISDLLTIKWGKAAEALFSLKKRRVALLEGELTAPGNEVAYIVKAKETFS